MPCALDSTRTVLDTRVVLIARINDWGFAVSPSPTQPELSPDGRWRLVYVDGVNDPVQFTTVTVLAEAPSTLEHQILVIGAYKDEPQSLVDEVARCFPKHAPAAIRKNATGWARAACADSALHEVVVASIGIVKASGGWDESSPIIVDIDDSQFEAFMEFRQERWQARVQRRR